MTPGDPKTYLTYAEFWPFYLSQHSQHETRRWHIIGTFLALATALIAVVCFNWQWLLVALVFGYGFAWVSHQFIEKNRPATFTYPLWSLRGDLHMFYLWLRGQLDAELTSHGIRT